MEISTHQDILFLRGPVVKHLPAHRYLRDITQLRVGSATLEFMGEMKTRNRASQLIFFEVTTVNKFN